MSRHWDSPLTDAEPSNMLDVPSITFLSNYLQTYPSTLLVVSHDRAFLNEVATDIIHQHSERLDYYKGADFGMEILEGSTRMLADADRL